MPLKRLRRGGHETARLRPAAHRNSGPTRSGFHRRRKATSGRRAVAGDEGDPRWASRSPCALARGFVDKTHHAAGGGIPPDDIWEPIQSIRRRYDRQLKRWMPHLTLLYPFRRRADFDEADPELRRACAAVQPFRATLGELRYFAHGRGQFTLWLAPEPAANFVRLQAVLDQRCPDCAEASRHAAGRCPRL